MNSQPTPASANQTELWLAEELSRRRGVYNVPALYRCDSLDVGRVKAALQNVVERFPALRTTLRMNAAGTLEQRVDAAAREPTVTEVVRASDAGLAEEMSNCVWRPFDLASDHPIRAHVIHDRDATVLLLVFHHTAVDEWSSLILLAAFWAAYTGAPGDDGEPEGVTYAEWTLREAEWLGSPDAAESVETLKRGCGPFPRGLPDRFLPGTSGDDRQSASAQTSVSEVPVEAALRAAGTELARSLRVTDFVLGLATFAVAIGRVAGVSRLVICIAAANRTEADVLGTVGPVGNTIPLPLDLGSCASLRDSVEVVRDAYFWGLDFQNLPSSVWAPAASAGEGKGEPGAFGIAFGRAEAVEAQLPAGIEPLAWYGFRPARMPLAGFLDSHRSGDRLLIYSDDAVVEPEQAARLAREWHRVLEEMTNEEASG
jgi:nonribosomal peptide synthetase DhbF